MNETDLQDLQKKIKETREIVERNHEMIEDIKRTIFWRRVMRIIYWFVIIGVAIGAFYFLQPYVDRVVDAFNQIKDGLNAVPQPGP